MERNVPRKYIEILHYWYINSVAVVKWEGCLSQSFPISNGVRQGGILSPLLFALYIDILVDKLRRSGFGCRIPDFYMGCILYADDVLLLSNSVTELQHILDICVATMNEIGMSFNVKKSGFMRCGNRSDVKCSTMYLGDYKLEQWTSIKYLGVVLKAGKTMTADFVEAKSSFYRCFNSIYAKSCMADVETIPIMLINSMCVPKLLYGIEVLAPRYAALKTLDNVVNRCVCRIFKTFDQTVIDDCRLYLGVHSVYDLYKIRACRFLLKLGLKKLGFTDFIFNCAYKEFVGSHKNMCIRYGRWEQIEQLRVTLCGALIATNASQAC
jgi:hypothetical protein